MEWGNVLTSSLVLFGQGALRCHADVLKELEAAHDRNSRRVLLVRFDRTLTAHVGFLLRNLGRTLWLRITRGRGALNRITGVGGSPIPGELRRDYRRLSCLSAAFARNADLAMLTLGGSLKRRER